MKKRILILSNLVYISKEQDEISIAHKIFFEFKKYYDLIYNRFKFLENSEEPIHFNKSMKTLPFRWSNFFTKALNIIYLEYHKIKMLRKNNYDLVWIWPEHGVTDLFLLLYPMFSSNTKFFINMGAVSVYKSKFKRMFYDSILTFVLRKYKYIGVNPNRSSGKLLIKTYKIPKQKIIPILCGFPDYGFVEKKFDNLRLLYIGTLNTREVYKSVYGVAIFCKEHPEIPIIYNIIGGGKKDEVDKLINTIKECNLENIVHYHGILKVEKVKEIFRTSNVGISYVPITKYFQNASTKTIEYLLSGMAVIATKNRVRSEIITPELGVLCPDNAEGISKAILEIYNNFYRYNSEKIRKSYEHYSMEKCIRNHYIPYLEKIISQSKQ